MKQKGNQKALSAPNKKSLLSANTQILVYIWEFLLERNLANILSVKNILALT